MVYMYTWVNTHTYIYIHIVCMYIHISQNFSSRCTRIIFSDVLRAHLCYISQIYTVTSGDIFGALTSIYIYIYIYGNINPFYYHERARRPWKSRIAAANLNKKPSTSFSFSLERILLRETVRRAGWVAYECQRWGRQGRLQVQLKCKSSLFPRPVR